MFKYFCLYVCVLHETTDSRGKLSWKWPVCSVECKTIQHLLLLRKTSHHHDSINSKYNIPDSNGADDSNLSSLDVSGFANWQMVLHMNQQIITITSDCSMKVMMEWTSKHKVQHVCLQILSNKYPVHFQENFQQSSSRFYIVSACCLLNKQIYMQCTSELYFWISQESGLRSGKCELCKKWAGISVMHCENCNTTPCVILAWKSR